MIGKTELISTLNPETRLLLRCLDPYSTFLPEDFTQLDPDTLLHVIACHRLSNIVYDTVKNNSSFPLFIKHRLRERYVSNKFRMLTYMAELCRVLKLFQERGISVVALKGPILGQLYYDDYTQRECNDLDILVKPSDVQTAYQILIDIGYNLSDVLWNSPKQKALYRKTFHHYNLYNSSNHIQIELHWRLNTLGSDSTKKIESVWENLTIQQIGGLSIQILSNYDTFIYLCIHGGTHQWKRLFWVQDIVRIIQKEGNDFLINTYHKITEKSVRRYVLEGCHLAHMLFGANLPQVLLNAIDEDESIAKLTEISIFSMSIVADSYLSPISSLNTFKLGIRKLVYFYRSIIYLEGNHAILTSLKSFFINPAYWNIYSFSDRLFLLNYIAAPFLWVYSVVNKDKE